MPPELSPDLMAWVGRTRTTEEDIGLTSVRRIAAMLDLDPGADDQAVLAAALRTGRVTHFAWREPTLVELFREAVAEPAGIAA